MGDPKNGKGGFKEFAKHEKILVNTVPGVTGAVASAPKADPTAPKPEGDGKVSRKS